MSMSKVVLSAAVAAGLMVAGINGAMAADTANAAAHGPDFSKMAHRMQVELKLDKDQTAKVEQIMKDMHQEAEDFRTKLEQDTTAKFKTVLTPDQFAKWEKMHQERMEKRQKMMQKMENK